MTSFLYDKIGEYFGHNDGECPKADDIPDFEPGALTNFGVTWIALFDQLLIPEEIRKARSDSRSPSTGRPPFCPPFSKRSRSPSNIENRFRKSSCS